MKHFDNRRTFRTRASALAFIAAGLIGAATAGAATATDTTRVTVRYSAQDLASDRGANALYGRIVAAARTACGERELDIRDLNAVAAVHSCEQVAIARAVDNVHSARLAATYGAHQQHS